MGVEVRIKRVEPEDSFYPKERKVYKFTRKVKTFDGETKTYVSPKIVLDSKFEAFIGKKFRVYIADVEIEEKRFWGGRVEEEGTAIILFFPGLKMKLSVEEREEEELDEEEWEEEEWEEDEDEV